MTELLQQQDQVAASEPVVHDNALDDVQAQPEMTIDHPPFEPEQPNDEQPHFEPVQPPEEDEEEPSQHELNQIQAEPQEQHDYHTDQHLMEQQEEIGAALPQQVEHEITSADNTFTTPESIAQAIEHPIVTAELNGSHEYDAHDHLTEQQLELEPVSYNAGEEHANADDDIALEPQEQPLHQEMDNEFTVQSFGEPDPHFNENDEPQQQEHVQNENTTDDMSQPRKYYFEDDFFEE